MTLSAVNKWSLFKIRNNWELGIIFTYKDQINALKLRNIHLGIVNDGYINK